MADGALVSSAIIALFLEKNIKIVRNYKKTDEITYLYIPFCVYLQH